MLYENITDGDGLAYHHYKTCGFLGCIFFMVLHCKHGKKRIEWSSELVTEILLKKKILKHTEV